MNKIAYLFCFLIFVVLSVLILLFTGGMYLIVALLALVFFPVILLIKKIIEVFYE